MPRELFSQYPVKENAQSKAGVYYVTASGEEIANEGEKHIRMTMMNGAEKDMTFQVTEVNKVLGSVSKICAKGHQVVFSPPGHRDGNFILNLQTGDRMPLFEANGTYKLYGWVNPVNRHTTSTSRPTSTFQWPAM